MEFFPYYLDETPELDKLFKFNQLKLNRKFPYFDNFKETALAIFRQYSDHFISQKDVLNYISQKLGFENWEELEFKLEKGTDFINIKEASGEISKSTKADVPITYEIDTDACSVQGKSLIQLDELYVNEGMGMICGLFLDLEPWDSTGIYKSIIWISDTSKGKMVKLYYEDMDTLNDLVCRVPELFKEKAQRIYDFELIYLFIRRCKKCMSEEAVEEDMKLISKGDIYVCDRYGLFYEIVSLSNKSFMLHEIECKEVEPPECFDPERFRGEKTPKFFEPIPGSFKKDRKPFRKILRGCTFCNNRSYLYHDINGHTVSLRSMNEDTYAECTGVYQDDIEENLFHQKLEKQQKKIRKKIESAIRKKDDKDFILDFRNESYVFDEVIDTASADFKMAMVSNIKDKPLYVQYRLASDKSIKTRELLARYRDVDPLVLQMLACDEIESVRRVVVTNKKLPIEAAEILAEDTVAIKSALMLHGLSDLKSSGYELLNTYEALVRHDNRLAKLTVKLLMDKDIYTYPPHMNFNEAINKIINKKDREICQNLLSNLKSNKQTTVETGTLLRLYKYAEEGKWTKEERD